MRSITLHNPSSFPDKLRKYLEKICSSDTVKEACTSHTNSPGSKILDQFFKTYLQSKGFSVENKQLMVAQNCKFDLDLLITGKNWVAAILIEGGRGARVDLNLLKFIAWGKYFKSHNLRYAVLVTSNKKLLRSITGTKDENAFDYAQRLLPLFLGTNPNITDLLIVEFDSSK